MNGGKVDFEDIYRPLETRLRFNIDIDIEKYELDY